MKKLKKNSAAVVFASALVALAGMTQACGGASGTATTPPASNTSGLGTGVGSFASGVDSSLANACSNLGSLWNLQSYGIYVASATSTTAADGTAVCKIQFMQQYGNGRAGVPRAYLGPNASSTAPLMTAISLDPFDSAQIAVSGTYTTGVFGGCGSNSVQPLMYGELPGIAPELINNATINVPSNGGGFLEVGLNQSSGSGDMCIEIQANITRCIDSSGHPHQC